MFHRSRGSVLRSLIRWIGISIWRSQASWAPYKYSWPRWETEGYRRRHWRQDSASSSLSKIWMNACMIFVQKWCCLAKSSWSKELMPIWLRLSSWKKSSNTRIWKLMLWNFVVRTSSTISRESQTQKFLNKEMLLYLLWTNPCEKSDSSKITSEATRASWGQPFIKNLGFFWQSKARQWAQRIKP